MNEQTTKVRVSESEYDETKVRAYHTQIPDQVGSLAIQFLERWGLVAAMPDGEDTAARQKMRLPTPEEIVTRAFDIAELSFKIARERGHMVKLPDLNELNAEADAKRRQRKEAREAASTA